MPTSAPGTQLVAYAHTLPGKAYEHWEPLQDHLENVARTAAKFGKAFGAQDWAECAGQWHDLGKYSHEFQQYLLATGDPNAGTEGTEDSAGRRRVDHSTFGARYAAKQVAKYAGQILAFCIAGHHAGLPDAIAHEDSKRKSTLQFRLDERRRAIPSVQAPDGTTPPYSPLRLPLRHIDALQVGFQLSFFTRMLFSCLIDADRLETEKFCNSDSAEERASVAKSDLGQLKLALEEFLNRKTLSVPKSTVNAARAQVLHACRSAAELAPGFFSLQVPTGGGKTYSSLAFALVHAERHQLRRVIVAIPFTSITEQTADSYREAFGTLAETALIEHHSTIQPKYDTRANQLGTENWDARVIVTTNVQFFESLFASATGACRKLHRLANSVIILDEAQTIPIDFLTPTLSALKELVQNYGCTVVLCTATQPALEKRRDFPIGITGIREIVPNAKELYSALNRVTVSRLGITPDAELVRRLAAVDQALCIVNTRRHAAELFAAVEGALVGKCHHLSTLMCGQHRRETLSAIKSRLAMGQPCRVISTQLVEAGVDLDFPVVFREACGFDSIAQAAGRCNREGKLREGTTYVFEPEVRLPPGFLRDSAAAADELKKYSDPLTPAAIEEYFRLLYWSQQHRWDRKLVMDCFNTGPTDSFLRLQFRSAAAVYQLVEQRPLVFIPYNNRAIRLQQELLGGAGFVRQRELQPYLVSIYPHELKALQQQNAIAEHENGMWILIDQRFYSPKTGLTVGGPSGNYEMLEV